VASSETLCLLWVKSRHRVTSASCPLYPPEADMLILGINVCYVPQADIVAAKK
jgi:hypothetical protein